MQATQIAQGKIPVIGKHYYGEAYGIDPELLSDEERLRRIVIRAAELANMHLVEVNSWRFKGGDKEGVSVIALVLESHIAVHTWPDVWIRHGGCLYLWRTVGSSYRF